MADEVSAVTERVGDQRRVGLEVLALDHRRLPVAGSVGDQEREALGKWKLLAPRQRAAGHASVDEEDRRPFAETLDM
jgi:hypothetical protein